MSSWGDLHKTKPRSGFTNYRTTLPASTGSDVSIFDEVAESIGDMEDTAAFGLPAEDSESINSPGSIPEIKNMYNHSTASDSRPLWSEEADLVLDDARLRKIVAPYAIVYRHSKIKDKGDGWKPNSIEIQSKVLKKFLDEVFEGYVGWDSSALPLTFYPPYREFFHRWEKLKSAYARLPSESVPLVEILIDILVDDMASYQGVLESVERTAKASFEDLWMIFPPGQQVVTMMTGNLCICRARNMTTTSSGLFLQVEQLDWNGRYCGFWTTEIFLPRYKGEERINTLRAYPLSFAQDRNDIEARILARGQRFAELRGFHVMKCTGEKYVSTKSKDNSLSLEKTPRPVSGRVIIDAYAFYVRQDNSPPSWDRSREAGSLSAMNSKVPASDERREEMPPLTNLECTLAVHFVRGFDLAAKQWCNFNIDELHDPDWSDVAHDMLVIPEDEKKLILALSNRERLTKGVFNDTVQHKDRGIIFLLCGPPGVGKTLTAEAVAEKFKVPLFNLGANDIGTSPEKVEPALKDAFECCRLWNALLLIDEADVFLAARESSHLSRNELVAVFLRHLELYQGLMFLTTNRIDAIDKAFLSRMDLILRYSPLDKEARWRVWNSFLELLGSESHLISKDDIKELSTHELNGRDIKNVIKTAFVLASEGDMLEMKHLQIVLNVRKKLKT